MLNAHVNRYELIYSYPALLVWVPRWPNQRAKQIYMANSVGSPGVGNAFRLLLHGRWLGGEVLHFRLCLRRLMP